MSLLSIIIVIVIIGIYSLLSRLEKPIHGITSAAIRQLYRRCCVLRSELPIDLENSGTGLDFSGAMETELARLNVLISISGSYFGQGEEYDLLNFQLYHR